MFIIRKWNLGGYKYLGINSTWGYSRDTAIWFETESKAESMNMLWNGEVIPL